MYIYMYADGWYIFMCMCTYICMYIRMWFSGALRNVAVAEHKYTHKYIYICGYTVQIHVYVYIHMYIHTHVVPWCCAKCGCGCIKIHTQIYIYKRICGTHTFVRVYKYVYTHICGLLVLCAMWQFHIHRAFFFRNTGLLCSNI